MKTILFVCTGNVCRSPMAEGLVRDLSKGRTDLQLQVMSAGLGALDGHPPSEFAVQVMAELGIDISYYRSQSLRVSPVEQADFIFTMTRQQQDAIHTIYPAAAEKTFLLREFEDAEVIGKDIADPIGQPLEVYRRIRDQIHASLPSILEFVKQTETAAQKTAAEVASAADQPRSEQGQPRRIALAGDHGGFQMKEALKDWLIQHGYQFSDFGSHSAEPADYAEYAFRVAREVVAGNFDRGVLLCKSGVGMSIAANRILGARAALVSDEKWARLSREHNDANILVLAAWDIDNQKAESILDVWLNAKFEGGRHERRVKQMDHPPVVTAVIENKTSALAMTDPEIFDAIQREKRRQQENIELIASENFTSPAILEAAGSVLTNKYAEGYPGKRYYGGCEYVDIAEKLAIDRAKQLFGAEHANVQPHSGSQANMAVYFATIQHGDTILTMELAHGGHLTHGSPRNFSGRFYKVVHYGVRQDTETIDYDQLAKLALECRPKMITAGASAYPRIIDFKKMRDIADSVGALLFVDMAHIAGLVAVGIHPSPVPYADFVTTTTHKTLRGPRSGLILCKAKYAKDIDSWVLPGIQGGPLMHIIAAKAVCFLEAMKPDFKDYQRQIVKNAHALAAALTAHGFRIVSGGTDNHLMLVDLRPKKITGKTAQESLDRAGITTNKNLIPYDPEKPLVTSGIRLGTPAVTTRGMKEAEMEQIAALITEVLAKPDDPAVAGNVKENVRALTAMFPLPY